MSSRPGPLLGERRTALARFIGGLTVSTLATLVLIPTAYLRGVALGPSAVGEGKPGDR